MWNSKVYQFTCLAQGLSCAHHVFTKLMKPIYSHLRTRGFLSTYYLDDSLLIGSNFFECFNNVKATEQILIDAGFIINYQKSVLIPTSEIEHLGFVINSITMTITLVIIITNYY